MAELEFVFGGTRSGKSRFALERARTLGGDAVTFVATARRGDAELDARIAEHRRVRPPSWKTVEVDDDLIGAVADAPPEHVLLVDSITLWASARFDQIPSLVDAWTPVSDAIGRRASAVVVVSDEIGLGVVPTTPIGRRFRDELGRLNQTVAREATSVVFMLAGLALPLK